MLFILFVTSLPACVSDSRRIPFNSKTAESIKEIQIYNLVVQDEIRPAIKTTDIGSSVLAVDYALTLGVASTTVGVISDHLINKKSAINTQNAMKDFYYNIEDVNFRELLAEKMNNTIAQIAPIENTSQFAEPMPLDKKNLKRKIAALSPGQALIVTKTSYSFTVNSKSLAVSAKVFSYMKSKKQKARLVFFNDYQSISPSYGIGGKESIKMWTANNAKLYRDTLESTTQELTNLIGFDMQAQKDKFCGNPVKAQLSPLGGNMPTKKVIQFDQIKQTIRVQDKTGALYSIPKTAISPDNRTRPARCNRLIKELK